jgi:hypothetical protein
MSIGAATSILEKAFLDPAQNHLIFKPRARKTQVLNKVESAEKYEK